MASFSHHVPLADSPDMCRQLYTLPGAHYYQGEWVTYNELPRWHEALRQPQALADSHLQAAHSRKTFQTSI